MLKYCLLFFVFYYSATAFAQQTLLKGRVFEEKTRITLSDIRVQDLTNKLSTTTDDKGSFGINAKIGDVLVFNGGFAYQPDTLLVTDLHEREVFLTPHQNFLNEVKVVTDSTKNFKHYYDPMFHGQTVAYQREANFNPTGGVAIRLSYWKKDAQKREKLEKEMKDEQEIDEINRIFVPKIIGKYVPLTGKDLDGFIALYNPDTTTYYANNFNLASYLNDCYKKYIKLPKDERYPAKLDDLKAN
jgi:hypothetical protein